MIDNGASRGSIEANAGFNELDVRMQPSIEGGRTSAWPTAATLKLGPGNRLKLATIDLHASGTLDLGGNDLLVEDDQFSASDTAEHVRQMLHAGYHDGAWDGAGLRSDALTAAGTTRRRHWGTPRRRWSGWRSSRGSRCGRWRCW